MFFITEKENGDVCLKILKGKGITEVKGIADCKREAVIVISFSEADNT
jgi:hypothetical protein